MISAAARQKCHGSGSDLRLVWGWLKIYGFVKKVISQNKGDLPKNRLHSFQPTNKLTTQGWLTARVLRRLPGCLFDIN